MTAFHATQGNVTDTFDKAKDWFSPLVEGLANLEYDHLPSAVRERLEHHPYMSAFQLVTLLVTLMPMLVWSPLVAAVGIAGTGPTAGSIFAIVQAKIGITGLMSVIQSAGMGGAWGMGILNAATAASSVVAGTLAELFIGHGP